MSFFTVHDHNAALSFAVANPNADEDVARAHRRLTTVRRELSRKLKLACIPLDAYGSAADGISQETTASLIPQKVMTSLFTRPLNSMKIIESNMGQDGIHSETELKPRRHPVIELRLAPENFTVELIVSPDAWYDQQNFVGKFTLQEQRITLYNLLQTFENDYHIGFWSGIHLQDMSLSTSKLPPVYLFNEFLSTFAASRDYFRIGAWFGVNELASGETEIVEQLFKVIQELYSVYEYVLWTSDNNYHKFYRKLHRILR